MFSEFPSEPQPLPTDPVERLLLLRNGLMNEATGGAMDAQIYRVLRTEVLGSPTTASLAPRFLRTCADPGDFWQFIKHEFSTYADRRAYLRDAFAPLLEHLERAPIASANLIGETLKSLEEGEVHRVWEKALARSASDPEGAVTAARTLLESVCKYILDGFSDEGGTALYAPGDDLPRLYKLTAEKLNLAPSQHTKDIFKRLLGGCATVVESLGAIRNRVGDAHGQGRRPVRIAARHAHLAVNLAGAMALYLAETAKAR